MTGYYRCFCKNVSIVASPLTGLLCKAVSFKWSPECQSAFEALKTLLCSAPVLVAPQFGKPFLLEVDASGTGVGFIADRRRWFESSDQLLFEKVPQTSNEL